MKLGLPFFFVPNALLGDRVAFLGARWHAELMKRYYGPLQLPAECVTRTYQTATELRASDPSTSTPARSPYTAEVTAEPMTGTVTP